MEMRVTLEQYGNEIIFILESEDEDDKYLRTTKVRMEVQTRPVST